MDMTVLGSVLTEQTKVNTLDKVNISLFKKTNDQAELQAAQLLESIPAMPEGSKGHNIDAMV
jgi:hypothetical protein